MELTIPRLATSFFFVAFVYMTLTLQVHAGFPPFYRKGSWGFFARPEATDERVLKTMVRFGFGMMAMIMLFAVTGLHIFLALAGLVAAGIGIWVRRQLFLATGVVMPWLTHPWTVRWPMLAFDLWTAGIALGFGSLVFLR